MRHSKDEGMTRTRHCIPGVLQKREREREREREVDATSPWQSVSRMLKAPPGRPACLNVTMDLARVSGVFSTQSGEGTVQEVPKQFQWGSMARWYPVDHVSKLRTTRFLDLKRPSRFVSPGGCRHFG